MSSVIIIGKGPAGISAALYTVRGSISTTVIGMNSGSLEKAEKIENYYGFEKPISGEALISRGIEQAKRLGVDVIDDEVLNISFDEHFTVQTKKGSMTADSVILATGTSRAKPRISGISEFEGRGVSYCAVCDAFFYREKDVAVIGAGEYALSEAEELSQTSKSVTILTNGEKPKFTILNNIKVITDEIASVDGDKTVTGVTFKNGNNIAASGVFIAIGVAGSSDLARKLGAYTEGSKIIADENMSTTVPGLYACGDCTGGMLQIAKAVYEGAKAGTEVIKLLRKNK
ncbi:MAG: NAD(P)/FAD-dependent oxidoreductase [Oscillospiraceae bacterium]|jgi:thioredoxin reductase (NADPH)